MITNVECIVSCADFPKEEKVFLKPIKVKLSEKLPIDIELSKHLWIHTKHNYIVIFDKTRWLKEIWDPMVDDLARTGKVKEYLTPMLKKEGQKLIFDVPFFMLEENPDLFVKIQHNRDLYEFFISAVREHFRNKRKSDLVNYNNLSSETYYSANGYTVTAGTKTRDRMQVLYRLSDENNNSLSSNFETYCWFIETKRSNKNVEDANKRRRRDLAALKIYEETGTKEFEEDWGQ